MINDGTHSDRYARILDRYEKEVREMEFRVQMLETGNRTNLKPKLHYVISLINSAVMYILDAPVEVKIKLIGLIFPEKIVFDGKNYQTKNMNRVLDLIYQQTNELRESGKEKRTNKNLLVHSSDSDRIQTCNLLIRSQVLYSVKLRSRFATANIDEILQPRKFLTEKSSFRRFFNRHACLPALTTSAQQQCWCLPATGRRPRTATHKHTKGARFRRPLY